MSGTRAISTKRDASCHQVFLFTRQCAEINSRNSDRNIMLFPSWSGPELSTLLMVGMSDVPGYRVSCYQNDTFLTSLLDSAVIGYSTIVMNSVKHGTNYCSTLYVSVKYMVMHREVDSRSVTGGNTFIRNKIKINLIFHLCCRIALILDFVFLCVFLVTAVSFFKATTTTTTTVTTNCICVFTQRQYSLH
jgi:hypothetical protein